MKLREFFIGHEFFLAILSVSAYTIPLGAYAQITEGDKYPYTFLLTLIALGVAILSSIALMRVGRSWAEERMREKYATYKMFFGEPTDETEE